jgi:glycosyltransferase involved in cell wall biosynthesis
VVLLTLAEGFAQKGYEVDFLLGRAGGPLMKTVPQTINLRVLKIRRMIGALFVIRRYIINEKPKAIIATQEHAHLIIILANLLSGKKTKIVIRIGTPFSILFKKYDTVRDKIFMPLLSKILYRFGDVFIAVTQGIAHDFAKTVGIKQSRITVIHNPKDIEKIERLGREEVNHPWIINKKVPLIISAGRLTEAKDFATLLKAFKLLTKKTDARLLILGDDGGEQKKMEHFIEENNLKEKVGLMGHVQNPYAYFAKADVFALSSKWEGLPNVIIEALVLGVPVVSTNCVPGGAEEILQDSYGILVPIKDPIALSEAIEGVLTDKEKALRYSEKGRHRAKDFSLETILNNYLHSISSR